MGLHQDYCRDCGTPIMTRSIRRGIALCPPCKEASAKRKSANHHAVHMEAVRAVKALDADPETLGPADINPHWCDLCKHYLECRDLVWTGARLYCQPKGIRAIPVTREKGDMAALFAGRERVHI